MTTDNIVINVSKTKMLFIIFVSLIFVVLGIWIIFNAQQPNGNQQKLYTVILLYFAGGLSVAFFGLCLLVGVWRLFSTTPGLELNNEGMLIYGARKPLFVHWQEIKQFSIFELHNQKFLVIHTFNPDKYLFAQGEFLQKMATASQNICGSPISVSSNTLDIKLEVLVETCERYLATYGIKT